MTKKYENPMLSIVSIKNNDIVTGSGLNKGNSWKDGEAILAPGERGMDYYEGY